MMRHIFTIMALTLTILACLSFSGTVSIHTHADSRTLATQQCSSALVSSVIYGSTVSVGLYRSSGCETSHATGAGSFFLDIMMGSPVVSQQSSSSTDSATGAVALHGGYQCCGGRNDT